METFEKRVIFSFEQNIEILAINLKSKTLPKKSLYENNAAVLISWNIKSKDITTEVTLLFLPVI